MKNPSDRFFLCKFWESLVFFQSANRKLKSHFRQKCILQNVLKIQFYMEIHLKWNKSTFKEFLLRLTPYCHSSIKAQKQRPKFSLRLLMYDSLPSWFLIMALSANAGQMHCTFTPVSLYTSAVWNSLYWIYCVASM